MTRQEKKFWKLRIEEFRIRYLRDDFFNALDDFYALLNERMTYIPMIDKYDMVRYDFASYVIWMLDNEMKRTQAFIYGMKNLDATNPKI